MEHPELEQPENDNINVSLSPRKLLAVGLPIAFLLGGVAGYFFGTSQANAALAEEAAASAQSAAAPAANPAGEVPEDHPPISVAEQIEGLPRHEITLGHLDPVLGPEDAPILLIEFSDFECPFCQRHFQQVYPQLQSTYPDLIQYVFLDFPLTSIHPNAVPAAEASLCAFEQDAFWPFHDLLFEASQGFSRSAYESYAAELGLDLDAFAQCLDDGRYNEEVLADLEQGLEIGVSSTPTFFINGIGLVGAQPFDVFAEIIDYELERLGVEVN